MQSKIPIMNTVSVGTASTLVLPQNLRRRWAGVYNSSGAGIWLSFGAAALIGYGAYIPPGGSYEIDQENFFTGPVYGIVSAGSQGVGTVEMQ